MGGGGGRERRGGCRLLLRNGALPDRSGALSKEQRGRGAAERGHRGAIKRKPGRDDVSCLFFATVDNPPFVDMMSIG